MSGRTGPQRAAASASGFEDEDVAEPIDELDLADALESERDSVRDGLELVLRLWVCDAYEDGERGRATSFTRVVAGIRNVFGIERLLGGVR